MSNTSPISPPVFSAIVGGYTVAVFFDQTAGTFMVQYGKAIYTDLTYEEAASHIGFSLMHGLQCEGKIDPIDPS